MKIVAKNRRARFDYELKDTFEAGISLLGSEVKSIKCGDVDLSGSYIVFDDKGSLQWLNGTIKKYEYQTMGSHDETRTRQLLLHKREIKKIWNAVNLERLTVVPTILYINHHGIIKIEIATARGKKKYDKREIIKKRDLERKEMKY